MFLVFAAGVADRRVARLTHGQVDLYGRLGSLLEVGTGVHLKHTGRENIYRNAAIPGMTRRLVGRDARGGPQTPAVVVGA